MFSPTERLQIAIEALPKRTAPYAILRIGMDDFGFINETHGAVLGNRVLQIAEQRLAAAVREHESVVRLPGDEFAVLLHSVQTAIRAGAAADRLNGVLSREYLVGAESISLTACIGVAVAPEDGHTAETLLQRANAALACAKAAGTGTVQLFEPAMETGSRQKRQSLALDLRKAVLLQQFEVHFQPQIAAKTRQTTGFEALLRWRHPDLGRMEPEEFLPLAEELGLMPTLGEFVLRTACDEAARMPAHLSMAVNVAGIEFRKGSFTDAVAVALHRSGLPPHRLELELREDALLAQKTLMGPALHELHRSGVRLVLDGFGTGVSSLGLLSRLPLHKVKLDRSLAGSTARQRAMVRAVATLAQAHGIATVAMGIETGEQMESAEAEGVTAMQGYLFGKAAPAATLPARPLSPEAPGRVPVSLLAAAAQHNGFTASREA